MTERITITKEQAYLLRAAAKGDITKHYRAAPASPTYQHYLGSLGQGIETAIEAGWIVEGDFITGMSSQMYLTHAGEVALYIFDGR